jgi:DNA-binding LacI/PurR family transcriptional regulator
MPSSLRTVRRQEAPVTLRTVADRVGLAPCSVSAVLNDSPAARGIPQHTKDRVLRAARELRYRPNFNARSLRTKRTYMMVLLAMDLGDARVARIAAAVESFLRSKGYSLLIAAWDGAPAKLENLVTQLRQRGAEGVIVADVVLPVWLDVPAVSIDLGSQIFGERMPRVTRNYLVKLGETAARELLAQVGHRTGDECLLGLGKEFASAIGRQTESSVENFAD